MLQLSMIGPPEPPKSAKYRDRLRQRIFGVLSRAMSGCGLEARALQEATEAVVDELTERARSLDAKTLVLRLHGDRPACWICGFPISLSEPQDAPGSFSLDHVVPRSKGGGRLGVANLKPAHRYCNIYRAAGNPSARRRAKARYAEFLATLASVPNDDEASS